ncbi:MAG: methylenetetrahydrofolate reductase C-terminal domain-containing protein [Chloroflexota bacterium]
MATNDTITIPLTEGKRAPGSEWLKDHPRLLEIVYNVSKRMIVLSYPLMKRVNAPLAERFMIWSEEVIKGWVFNCQMCGQCILHSTGMTCPMNCPKNLRNGPCGGVRIDGHCEVIPELPCVWVQAWERSKDMTDYANDIFVIQPPVNRTLKDSSAWINMLDETDTVSPPGWVAISE